MVVDKGNIAEYGPQEELIGRKGLYYQLLRQQQMNQ